jgi:D-arginine dehydrogenase
MSEFDIAIIGAGIAGASLAAQFASDMKIVILEAEQRPGYHATGRSAAFWTESYGGPLVQPLTTVSGPFLENPPTDFADHSFLKKRGALYLGTRQDSQNADALIAQFDESGVEMERWEAQQIAERLPAIRPEWDRAIWEPSCCDIDVAALHAAYLRQAKRRGVKLVCSAALQSANWRNNIWNIHSKAGSFRAKVLVNAAGAWADDVARLCGVPALNIQPFRRTVMQLRIAPSARDDLPLVIGLDGSFYFKPAGVGRLWLSPHDETPSLPCDTAPDELDVAKAIERLGQVVDWEVTAIEAKWAGLRSFAPDRLPVIGEDPGNTAFFWLAGQGGFGIQTAPAIAALAASQLSAACNAPHGIVAEIYAPHRLRKI